MSTTPASPNSRRLRLVPELLPASASSKSRQQTTLPTWIRSGLTTSSDCFNRLPGYAKPTGLTDEDSPLLATEAWAPPPDAHPTTELLEFVVGAWKLLEPSVPFVPGWHITLLCKHLEALSLATLGERDLLINEPPGSSKSLITAVMWPAWVWTWAPWTRWLTTSYDDAIALRDAVRTRMLMRSEWYQGQVSEPWSWAGDQNVKSYYLNNRTGWRVATSVNGSVTSHHAHYVLVDDPHNVNKAESDAVRATTLTTLKEVFPSRVLPGGCRVIIGQRVHEEDATADWLEREGETIHHIELREERELPRPDEAPEAPCSLTGLPHDGRETEGELLTPQRFDAATMALRAIQLGPYAYSAQYQQRPTPRAGMILNQAWFPQTPRLDRSVVDVIAALDLNYSDAETSDWTVGMLGAVERSAVLPRLHVVDVFREHLSDERHEQAIGDWILLWKPIMVGIEKRAFEKQGATMDLCRRLEIYCSERGFICQFEPIPADTDKVTRAMVIPGRAKAGLISVDRRAPWWQRLAREMSTFPKSEHDDQIDALAYLVRMSVEKLEKIRAMMALMGHSVPVAYEETPGVPDWAKAALQGLR